MSQWDKLISEILSKSPSLRFEDLSKALIKIGYRKISQKEEAVIIPFVNPAVLP